MIQIPEEPQVPDADRIALDRLHGLAERHAIEQPREIDPGVDRELQRPPEAAVYLDEVRRPRRGHLELRHRDAVPAHRIQEPLADLAEEWIDAHALAQHTDPARHGLLSKPPVSEERQHLAGGIQGEHTLTSTRHTLLDENWMVGEGSIRGENQL